MAQCSRCGSDCWEGKPCNCKEAQLIYPQAGVCGGCPDWDDINGCWAGHSEWYGQEGGADDEEVIDVLKEFTDTEREIIKRWNRALERYL